MKWFGLVGVGFLVMISACGTESARPPAPPGNTDEPAKTAVAEPTATTTATQTAATPNADGTTNPDGAKGADKPIPSEQTAKPGAPVEMTAKFRTGGADLDIVFAADATNVTIKVWGVDGLTITKGATPVSAPSARTGQSMKVSVDYNAPAATQSNLAVSVSGMFGGREQAKVQSFTINAGAPSGAAPVGETKVDKDGRRVKVMK